MSLGTFDRVALGYSPADLDRVPSEAIDSFAGAGHFFHHGDLRPGEHVIDLGSDSGMDSFIAALRVGGSGRVAGPGVGAFTNPP